MSNAELGTVVKWMSDHALPVNGHVTLDEVLESLAVEVKRLRQVREEAEIEARAVKVHLASIQRMCEARWVRGDPCPLCNQLGHHSGSCYARSSIGYDLLNEHDATVRENDSLRAALAAKLPVNGKHILAGGKYVSLRDRVRGRYSKHDG